MRAMLLRIKRRQRGFIFLTAMLALVVMLLVGTAFMGAASQQLNDAHRDLASLHALATADAGLNYAVWRQRYSQFDSNYAVMPVVNFPATMSLPTALNGDTCSVTVSRVDPGYEALSAGAYRGGEYVRTLRAMLHPPTPLAPGSTDQILPPVFDHALFSATNLELSGNSNIVGDVGCNLDLRISGTPNVTGDVQAGGTITGNTVDVTGTVTSGATPTELPPLELYKFLAKAQQSGIVYDTDLQLSGGTVDFSNKVVYIKGQLHISASTQIIGPTTIIAEGGVVIDGNTTTTSATTSGNTSVTDLVIMTPGDVRFNGTATLNAVVYAHSMDATFTGNGTATITGAVIADSVVGGGTVNIAYRRPSIDNIIVFPGSNTVGMLEWTIASWQVIN